MKNKFRKLILMICLILVTTLTGCANQEYSLQINDDDTCVFSCEVTVNNDVYSLLGTYGIDTVQLNKDKNTSFGNELDNVDALFQELAIIYNDFGYTITAINDTIDIGFLATKKYNSIDELNKEVKELNQLNICGFNFEIMSSKTKFDTEYKVYGTLNYILDSDIDLTNELINENFHQLFDTSTLKAICRITMPMSTSVTASDGIFEKNEFTWTANYDDNKTTDVHIISSYKNTSMYALVIAGIAVVLVIVGIFVARAIQKMKVKKNHDFYTNDLDDVDK